MFSVPGWNVSASVATQVEQSKPKDPNKLGKKAQKRQQKPVHDAIGDNLGELLQKAMEEKTPTLQDVVEPVQNEVEATGDATEEKRGKKRKRGTRGKNSKAKPDGADGDASAAKPDVVEEEQVPVQVPSTEKSTTTDGESKRDKKKRKKEQKADTASAAPESTARDPTAPVSLIPEPQGLTPLQKSMRSKLASARFRHMNESLYTKPSAESLDLFKTDPSMFEDYHRGFAQQVEVWPSNPVDSYVTSILSRGKLRTKDPWKDKKRLAKKGPQQDAEPDSTPTLPLKGDAKPLPRNFKNHCTIADLGCGTASLSYRLQSHLKPLDLTLHSFDLAKPTGPSASLVTVADICALPLPDNSADVAIFCLALMGTNWLAFIDEAYRILRWRGELWVSEIKSRFGRVDSSKKGAQKNKVPINSIGSLRKKPAKKPKASDAPAEGPQDSADETELAERVDGQDVKEGTDISAFVEVLRKRGFVLDALPERPGDAVDFANKMFVKMQFVKGAQPSRGKNAKEEGSTGGGGGARNMKFGIKGKKFNVVGEDKEVSAEAEGKTLKPCLYKVR
ncbi:hypothetical protein P153DRAFT_370521 [Dothidotthia symphoricarpi CBS 119687]|uniref:Ribosomal RNA-processing protein 8 n=1 Tax=Dothidotthia symphoricarpi CBS 119687 TaxID=1392245 RepID=A0A6A6A208_9PLEO|nr:uncharacterized protein P153DRAFT_370521 [Dothidotthia symphoricarpi CBS 119687]KAF2125214.1 hypothetical protein P153DRAFT_370521 [Dothidotthia symphoricarpi CBS 119687]